MPFPKEFLWGGAVAGNQYEGGYQDGGRGLSTLDAVTGGGYKKPRMNPDAEQTEGNQFMAFKNPYLETSDWGWTVDPTGLCIALCQIYDRYHVPLFIVENGLGAADEIGPEGTFDTEKALLEEVQNTAGETEEQAKEQPDTPSETDRSEGVATEEQEAVMSTKTLVVYFSCTGTTKPLAEYAAEILGADIYEIVAEDPYTEADLAYYTGGRADQEQSDPDVRPAISGNVENMDVYDTILIGYPIWHGQAPRIISTFLESYDFFGKTIVPFCTSHSSGLGSSATNLHGLCSDSTEWMEGRRFEAGTSRDTIEEWLDSIGIK